MQSEMQSTETSIPAPTSVPGDRFEITFLPSTWDRIDNDPTYRHDVIIRLTESLSACRREIASIQAEV